MKFKYSIHIFNLNFLVWFIVLYRFHMYLKTMELVFDTSHSSMVEKIDHFGQDIMAARWLERAFV